MRTYKINDDCIKFYELCAFRNHSRTQYMERQRGWIDCKYWLVKKLIGEMWRFFRLWGHR